MRSGTKKIHENLPEALQKMPGKCQWWLQTHRQAVPGDPRSEGTEVNKGNTGYTGAVRVSKEKRWPNTRKPSRTVAMILQERILAQGRAFVRNIFLLGLRDTLFLWARGGWHNQSLVACLLLYGVLIRGDSIQLIMIRVNHSATISTGGIDHNFTFTWLVVPWHKPEKTTSTQSKLTKYHYLMIYVNIK